MGVMRRGALAVMGTGADAAAIMALRLALSLAAFLACLSSVSGERARLLRAPPFAGERRFSLFAYMVCADPYPYIAVLSMGDIIYARVRTWG